MSVDAIAPAALPLLLIAFAIALGVEAMKRLAWIQPMHAKQAAWAVGAVLVYLGDVLMAIGRGDFPNLASQEQLFTLVLGALAGLGAIGEYEVLLRALFTRLFGAYAPPAPAPVPVDVPSAEHWPDEGR